MLAKILILDDSPTFCAVTKQNLENKGFQVFVSYLYEEALKILDEEQINLMVLDWELPEMMGTEVVRRLRANWRYFDLPVIMVTGRSATSDVIKALDAGCDDFISKENDLDILSVRIDRILFQFGRISIDTDKKKRTVLLVDDSLTFLAITQQELNKDNNFYKVETVSSGKEALELLAKQPFDLLLVDWMMPEMSGLELIRLVRENSAYKHIPAVMLSGKDALEDAVLAMETGADDFIEKKMSLKLVDKKIRVFLRIQEQHRVIAQRIIEEKHIVEMRVQERTHELTAANEQLKQTQSQLVQSERMVSLGQLVAGVAHEINNPLAFLTNYAHIFKEMFEDYEEVMQALKDLKPEGENENWDKIEEMEDELDLDYYRDEIPKMVKSMRNGLERIKKIVADLRSFSQMDKGEWAEVDLVEGLESVLNLLNHQLKKDIEVKKDYAKDLPWPACSPSQIIQVFMNVLTNSIQAMPDGGTLQISTKKNPDGLRIEFMDTGCGMDEEVLTHVFNPFYTTKDVGCGTGLGLSVAHGIIEQHNGKINITSQKGKGTTCAITLPLNHDAKGLDDVKK